MPRGRPRKPAAERTGPWCADLSPEAADCFDAYCVAKGLSRAQALERVVRLLKASEATSEALRFRTLQKELP